MKSYEIEKSNPKIKQELPKQEDISRTKAFLAYVLFPVIKEFANLINNKIR